uniref:Si:ch211-93n23.7 n=1 Tax=Paramormyrops kingsleyae TaxID=1676925 RepID=A0A3B3QD16_9TELE|nr:protein STPG4 [Paramormyrops kingsleyae]
MTLYRERAASNVKGGLGDDDNHRPKSKHTGDMTGREAWWRCTLKDSPNPGSYHIRDFMEEAELNPVRVTYGFGGQGRKVPVHCGRQGKLLLPGAYENIGSIQEALKRPASYVFKSCPRPQIHTLGIRDKDVDLSPCHYDVTEKPVPKLPSKHPMFRSTVKRAPPPPREGPGPGHYDLRVQPSRGITSCFLSTVPRLHNVPLKTPGPGAYEPALSMGRRFTAGPTRAQSCSLLFRGV